MAAFLKLKDPSIRDMPGQPEIKTGKFEGIPVIIKVQDIKEVGKENFLYTTKAHMLMTKRIPTKRATIVQSIFFAFKGERVSGSSHNGTSSWCHDGQICPEKQL